MDTIEVHDLEIRAKIGKDPWERNKLQPVLVTIKIQASTFKAGLHDNVTESIHYGKITKKISSFVEAQNLKSIESLALHIAYICLAADTTRVYGVFVVVKKPKVLLHADCALIELYRNQEEFNELTLLCREEIEKVGIQCLQPVNPPEAQAENSESTFRSNLEISKRDAGNLLYEDLLVLKDLRMKVLLGVNLWERYSKQDIFVDLTIHLSKRNDSLHPHNLASATHSFTPKRSFRKFANTVLNYVESGTSYLTVEALATAIARVALIECHIEKISVHIKKPSALMFAKCSAVRVTKTRDQIFSELKMNHDLDVSKVEQPKETIGDKVLHTSYIGVGSNLGDRLQNIHTAIKKINSLDYCKIIDTGFLYVTNPMYVLDQPQFLNTAFKIKTSFTPHQLLSELKKIEAEIGRKSGGVRFGPRLIDLDILFYDSIVLETSDLVIPHPRVHERHFQLRPVCDMDPYVIHVALGVSVEELGSQLTTHKGVPNDLVQVMPLANTEQGGRNSIPNVGLDQKHTLIMGIINATPDSFSDGGLFSSARDAVARASEMAALGAEIIDIGGQSTRPDSEEVALDEEIGRIVPVIEAIKRSKECDKAFVSVDTFVAKVAEKALDAGADMINDISGGSLDSGILKLAAARECPIILMHMRGTPQTMSSYTDYTVRKNSSGSRGNSGTIDDVILGVREELAIRVRAALDAGVPRFNIILDPGIGFAKTFEQNFEILRRLPELTGEQLYSTNANPYLRSAARSIHRAYSIENNQSNIDFQHHELLPVSLAGFPVLVGTSRKSFIGKATGKADPRERAYGTAATVTSAIQGAANIVRVHDVEPIADVVKVSDHIYR